MHTRVRWTIAVVAVLLAAGCDGQPAVGSNGATEDTADGTRAASGAAPAPSYTGYPDSIVVLGHSQATGENTKPYQGGDTRTNSWATGINPDVHSVYQRILQKNPAVEGHAVNYAEPGASIYAIADQAERAAATHPDLVLIQAIDGDVTCPATEEDLRLFGDEVAAVLEGLASRSPGSRVFFTSQYGSPATYAKSLSVDQRSELNELMGGEGPCVFVDPEGRLVREEADRLEKSIVAFEQRLATVCDAHPNCAHDRGAFSAIVERPGDYTDDLNHLSIQGLARAAKAAWAALRDAGLAPST